MPAPPRSSPRAACRSTVSGVGDTSSPPPQAATPTSRTPSSSVVRAARFIVAESNGRSNGRSQSPSPGVCAVARAYAAGPARATATAATAPTPTMSDGVSLRRSETAIAASRASVTGERGRRRATATSTPSPTRTTATAPGARGGAADGELEPVGEVAGERAGAVSERARDVAVAARRGVDADEDERERDRGRRERADPRGRQAESAQAHGQHGVADQEHDETAAVGAEPVAADRDERQDGDRDAAGAEERGADEGGHEQQRLEEVVDPVEAARLRRAERRERDRLRIESQREEVGREDRGAREPERQHDGCHPGRDREHGLEPEVRGERDEDRPEREHRPHEGEHEHDRREQDGQRQAAAVVALDPLVEPLERGDGVVCGHRTQPPGRDVRDRDEAVDPGRARGEQARPSRAPRSGSACRCRVRPSGGSETRISGSPGRPSSSTGSPPGTPPSRSCSTRPRSSAASAASRVTVGPAPGTSRPSAALPSYSSSSNGGTTRTPAPAGGARTRPRATIATSRRTRERIAGRDGRRCPARVPSSRAALDPRPRVAREGARGGEGGAGRGHARPPAPLRAARPAPGADGLALGRDVRLVLPARRRRHARRGGEAVGSARRHAGRRRLRRVRGARLRQDGRRLPVRRRPTDDGDARTARRARTPGAGSARTGSWSGRSAA